jgi:PPK2 family polyphosphate:nucleotide phosphotransferase
MLPAMDLEKALKKARKFSRPYVVGSGKKFRLKHFDPADTRGFGSEAKPAAREALEMGVETLAKLQDILYAQDRWALLLIFQAMDAAGKDGAIKHVMSGVNPQGCQVASFKAPSAEELDHDFLWRSNRQLPERGRIGIFNRSYYEDVLVVKVHQELLEGSRLPQRLIKKDIWENRYRDIRAYERYLAHNGVVVRKFFLHISREEQKRRFLERIENPDKNWKFSAGDVTERASWKDYMRAYEEMIQETATEASPWYVVPADNKWFTRLVVAAAVVDTLDSLGLGYPKVGPEKIRELAEVKKALLAEK